MEELNNKTGIQGKGNFPQEVVNAVGAIVSCMPGTEEENYRKRLLIHYTEDGEPILFSLLEQERGIKVSIPRDQLLGNIAGLAEWLFSRPTGRRDTLVNDAVRRCLVELLLLWNKECNVPEHKIRRKEGP